MNLVFRLIWMMITARFAPKIEPLGEAWLTFRCWPSDLDLNFHMTNSRYASLMDLARINLMIRSGAWARLRGEKLAPVLSSLSIRFRRPVNPFQKFSVSGRLLSWDERWLYIEHRIMAGKELAAIGIVNCTFLSKEGRVPTEKLIAILGYTGPRPEFSDVLAKKVAFDATMKA